MNELIKLLTGVKKAAKAADVALNPQEEKENRRKRLASQKFMASQRAEGKARTDERAKRRGLKKKAKSALPPEQKAKVKPWWAMNVYDLFDKSEEQPEK